MMVCTVALTLVQETGVQTAIQAIYRDLDYAKSLVKARATLAGVTGDADVALDEIDIEESWTFIGDESDPDLQKQIQDWEAPVRGRGPRVKMDPAGLRSMQGVEPVRKSSMKR
jgi:sterol 3beta-glucosyltransferase